MPTLLLSQRHSSDSNAMWRAAIHEGWGVERIRGYSIDPDLAAKDPVLYGETLLADALAAPLDLAFLEPTADWLPSLPERYRRRAVRLATLADARALTQPSFVKPPDEKWFGARVYESGAALEVAEGMEDEYAVLIAEPVVFEVEYRFFVLSRAVSTGSIYIRGGAIARSGGGEWPADPAETEAAAAFLQTLLRDPAVELPVAVVIDVGRIQGRGWAVVEANPAWASGLCDADPLAVLAVLRRATVPRAALVATDRRWVRGAASEA
jgi:ATP-grasp domain, R2K clade family 2